MTSQLQNFVQPAQNWFGYNKEPYAHTQYEQINSTSSSPYVPHSATMYQNTLSSDEKIPSGHQRAFKSYKKMQRVTDIAFGIADVCSCLLTLLIEAIMIYMLVKFYQTQNMAIPGRSGPWSKDTQLWPTYLMGSVALTTFILAFWGLILEIRRKKSTTRARLTVKVVRVVLHIGAWIAVAAFYRIARTGTDLWGWSCSEKAAAIQSSYSAVLSFDTMCNIQSGSWYVSLAEAGIKIAFAALGFWCQFKLVRMKRDILKVSGEAGWDAFMG